MPFRLPECLLDLLFTFTLSPTPKFFSQHPVLPSSASSVHPLHLMPSFFPISFLLRLLHFILTPPSVTFFPLSFSPELPFFLLVFASPPLSLPPNQMAPFLPALRFLLPLLLCPLPSLSPASETRCSAQGCMTHLSYRLLQVNKDVQVGCSRVSDVSELIKVCRCAKQAGDPHAKETPWKMKEEENKSPAFR